ncbi:glycosyltransferase [Solimonas sp. K1W22B-7]|uniref:glycosyltransferase n=1 Tax=Solimonas sp. K1W22B-7 TaxID=2303331 RepID=UPI000E3371BE|nr:glycosyltransferase [Solimonas sp. K1W22B-7]AXQ28867.1 glycosyltransferase [Solimonas sp. K1W22B-7]
MRILLLTKAFSDLSQTFVYDRAVALRDRGHEVHVVTQERLMERERPFDKVVVLRKASWPVTLAARIRDDWGQRLKMAWGDAQAVPQSSTDIRYLDDLRAVVARIKPDYIHAEFGRMGVFAGHLATPTLPLVVFMHGFDITAMPRASAWRRRYASLWRKGVTILTPSEFMRQKVIALGAAPDQVVVQQNGIELGTWSYSDPADRFNGKVSFLFVGRLVEKKGPRELIAAFARMRELAPEIDAELTLCGSGKLAGPVREDVERLKLGGVVHLRGAVSSAEVREAMTRAHIMMQHSVETPDGDMEGLPVSLTEAAAIGLPIIATRHSGIPEIVEDGVNGFLVAEHDVEAMAQRMVELARTPQRWSSFGRAGRTRVEELFASDAAIARYERLVEQRVVGPARTES